MTEERTRDDAYREACAAEEAGRYSEAAKLYEEADEIAANDPEGPLSNTATVALSPAMLERLRLEPGRITTGNVAANAIRATFATEEDPFAGMNVGWADELPEVLEYLVHVVEAVDHADDGDQARDVMDAIVEVMSQRDAYLILSRLGEYVTDDDVEEFGLEPSEPRHRLYRLATDIATALA